jgi:hypothetical protein
VSDPDPPIGLSSPGCRAGPIACNVFTVAFDLVTCFSSWISLSHLLSYLLLTLLIACEVYKNSPFLLSRLASSVDGLRAQATLSANPPAQTAPPSHSGDISWLAEPFGEVGHDFSNVLSPSFLFLGSLREIDVDDWVDCPPSG